jgi:hypothetical protein
MDSPSSLRINPYQLCETPLVLAVVAAGSVRNFVCGGWSEKLERLLRLDKDHCGFAGCDGCTPICC